MLPIVRLTEFEFLCRIARAGAAYPVAIVMPALHAFVGENVSSSMRKVALRGRGVVDMWALGGSGDAPLIFLLLQVSFV